jgi:hypothetical protein
LEGRILEHYATESAERYPGPLTVLISGQSASASEIFAGAMKFHHRALIIGSPFTFGKGTAQNYIELAKTSRSEPNDVSNWGTLRLTYERFYQPNGQAVQRTGIAADIVLPQIKAPGFKREELLPHALPAESVPAPAAAVPVGIKNPITLQLCTQLRQRAEEDIGKLPEWSLYQREREFYDALWSKNDHSLQLVKSRTEYSETERKAAALRADRRKLAHDLGFQTETIEIGSVQTAINEHRAHLTALTTASGEPRFDHLEHGGFIFKTEKGLARRIWVNQIEYQRFLGNSEQLATAFAVGSGLPRTTAEMYKTFQTISLLEEPTENKIIECFATSLAPKPDPAIIRKGIEAVLLRMTEIDGDLRRHRPALDVQLREALRLTACWSEILAGTHVEAYPQ